MCIRDSPKLQLPGYAEAYDRARAELNAGRYRAALSTIATIDNPDAKRVALLRADALQGLGESDAALGQLAGKPFSNDLDVLNTLGKLAIENQQFAQLDAIAKTMLSIDTNSIQAHLMQGLALEHAGKYEEAQAAYHWFVEGQQAYLNKWSSDPDQFENADDLCDIATAIHRWATLGLKYKDTRELNDTVLNLSLIHI